MSLKVGIVGLPNVGKSTLFNALTRGAVPAENYPFCTIDPSIGIVGVPDKRLDTLTELSGSAETIPAAVEFVDIAGLVRGASEGEGLGNTFLSHIREVDMIAEVVRIFEDPDVHHVAGAVDPLEDIETINLELVMADAATVEKRLEGLEKEVKRGDKDAKIEQETLTKLLQHLRQGRLANRFEMTEAQAEKIGRLHLLTLKPFLYVCNKKHTSYNFDENNDERWTDLVTFFEETNSSYVVVDAGIEHELKDLDEEDKLAFRREYGTQESGVDSLVKQCYATLGLMSFFTTGEKETRAWTVRQGSTAPEAGAVIHSDFEEKFIRAQVVSFEDLVAAGSIVKAKENGKLRTEGKEYVVQEGDVIEFLHG